MCGRFAFILPDEAVRQLFADLNRIEHPSRYNIAPTQPVLTVRPTVNGLACSPMRWGLVPKWVDDPHRFPVLINARAETIAQKPAFRDLLARRRCIVPASGYYEWQKRPDGTKQPHYIVAADGVTMAFAGLWATWSGPDGKRIDSVSLATVAAAPDMAAIHDRTPAILDRDAMNAWLDLGSVDAVAAHKLLVPLVEGKLVATPVSSRVNSVRNDDAGLIEPVSEQKPTAEPVPQKRQLDLF